NSFDHKANVTQRISNVSIVGTVAPSRYTNNLVGFTWTDGTPTVAANNSATGLFIAGQNKGYSITVPADTTVRKLIIYVGAWQAQGKLVAHLSDKSANDYVDTSVSIASGSMVGVYTLTYSAASSGQTLSVTYTQNTAAGNVTLQAAALQ